MIQKLYPRLVTLLGGVGLGLALTYFVGVGLVFHPAMEAWGEFFLDWAVVLILPPYLLLVVHLVLRNHVGRYLLNRGAYDPAVAYSQDRVGSSLMRGKREAANQRLVWAQGLIGKGEYEEARAVLESRLKQFPANYETEARRWLVEIALRQDDRIRARELLSDLEKARKKGGRHLGALMAARGELSLREEDLEGFREAMLEALWAAPALPRVGLTRILALLYSEDGGEEEGDYLETLDLIKEKITREIPARESELEALRAWALMQRGDVKGAEEAIEAARGARGDSWSEVVISRVSEGLESLRP